jgi:2-polyprenyl-3-methyl-5-hydroxy-6-metoxy-1,4-benzoquinol methylase
MLKQYSFYALVWDLGSALNGHMAEARQYIEELKFDKTKDIRVLGCGVGTGIFEMEVLRQFPRAHVTAIDLNQQMLDVFKRKTASSAFQGRVNSLQGDLGNVLDSLSQTAYDLAIAGAVFEHIEDPSDILKKIHSLLEEDGVFFISSLRQTLAGRFIGFCCGVRPLQMEQFVQKVENAGFTVQKSYILPFQWTSISTWKNVWVRQLKVAHYFMKK